jgi:hypothetical protein
LYDDGLIKVAYILKERDYSKDLGMDGRITLERILGKYCGKMCTGCICVTIGTSGRPLQT